MAACGYTASAISCGSREPRSALLDAAIGKSVPWRHAPQCSVYSTVHLNWSIFRLLHSHHCCRTVYPSTVLPMPLQRCDRMPTGWHGKLQWRQRDTLLTYLLEDGDTFSTTIDSLDVDLDSTAAGANLTGQYTRRPGPRAECHRQLAAPLGCRQRACQRDQGRTSGHLDTAALAAGSR